MSSFWIIKIFQSTEWLGTVKLQVYIMNIIKILVEGHELLNMVVMLTNLGQGGDKDPEGDDEGYLHSLELHVEDMIVSMSSMTMSRLLGVVTK